MTSFIKVPFASSGDKAAVPDTDAGGGVNMTQGYGQAYSLDPATDPSAKRIERDKMNWLFNRITQAINEIQSSGVATFIANTDNGGSAFSYGKGALVSLGGVVYQSLTAANNTIPPSASWEALPEKIQPLDATLTALASLIGAANKLPYFNGDDTATLTDLTQVGRDIIGKADIAAVLTYLGLDHFGYEPSTGETAIFNGNKNLRYFINNNNESGVASVDFGLLWGFDDTGRLTKGVIPVARLDGLSSGTGTSTTAVMSQKATTDAINAEKTTIVQQFGQSTTSVISQKGTTDLVNDAASVGVNQLWNDVTATRAVGVNYTNNTGRPIVIAMNVTNIAINTLASSLAVQGILMTTGSPVSGEHRYISAIVPPGQTYKFTPVATAGFTLWELRA